MANLAGFNAMNHEPSTAFDVLPAGDYEVVIIESNLVNNKSGSGSHLALTMQVINGPYQNRKLWGRLNIDHPNPEARKIGCGELSAICRAVSVLNPTDSSELHNKPLKVKVVVKTDDKGNDGNEVKGYKPRHSGPGPSGQAQVAPAPQPQLGPSGIAQPLVTQSSAPAGTPGPRNPFASS